MTEPGIANEKRKRNYFYGRSGGMPPPPPSTPQIVKVKTKTCAIWGILQANLKKCSTLKFMMNISFVPSICIHRSIILIFIEKTKVCLSIFFPRQIFPGIFSFHFHENPQFWNFFPGFSIFISTKILVSATNSRLCLMTTTTTTTILLLVMASLAQCLRCPSQERKISGSNPACTKIFSGSSHITTSDFKIGAPVATLPGAWRYKVSAGTGWPGVSLLWLGEMESWICNYYLSVAARNIVWADLSLRYNRMLLGH